MSLTQKELDQYEEFWRTADKNNDGYLTIQELWKAVKARKPDVTDAEIAGMFCGIDSDEDKRMSKREYMTAMTEKKRRSQAMLDLFRKYDKDRSNTLSRAEIIEMIRDTFPKDKVNYVVGEFLSYSDFNKDGQVTFGEFERYFG